VTHRPRVRGIAASADVWLRALNRRPAPHQLDNFTLYSYFTAIDEVRYDRCVVVDAGYGSAEGGGTYPSTGLEVMFSNSNLL